MVVELELTAARQKKRTIKPNQTHDKRSNGIKYTDEKQKAETEAKLSRDGSSTVKKSKPLILKK